MRLQFGLLAGLAALATAGPAAPASAQDGAWIYNIFVAECRKAGGTPQSSLAQYLGGERFVCREGASSRSSPGPGGGSCAEAKANVDWVFADGGARRTFQLRRGAGRSAYEAVLDAQGHNPNAQAEIRRCRDWVEAYLNTLDAPSGTPPPGVQLGRRPLGAEDCECVSVLPANLDGQGRPTYEVENACDGLDISVGFKGDILQLSSDYSLTTRINAGPMGTGESRRITGPAWRTLSISAIGLRNETSAFTCRF